jgi:hypothetical protein
LTIYYNDLVCGFRLLVVVVVVVVVVPALAVVPVGISAASTMQRRRPVVSGTTPLLDSSNALTELGLLKGATYLLHLLFHLPMNMVEAVCSIRPPEGVGRLVEQLKSPSTNRHFKQYLVRGIVFFMKLVQQERPDLLYGQLSIRGSGIIQFCRAVQALSTKEQQGLDHLQHLTILYLLENGY